MTHILPLAMLFFLQAQATPIPDPRAAVQQSFHLMQVATQNRTRYTFLEREHFLVYDSHGKKTSDIVRTYEVTWINDLPYYRLRKIDDLPLSAKQEQKEQELFDTAVAKQRALGFALRAKSLGLHMSPTDANVHLVLTPEYDLTQAYIDTSGDEMENVVEASLKPDATRKSKCPWRFQLWITMKGSFMSRYVADIPADQTLPCHGNREEVSFQLLDGDPHPARYFSRYYSSGNNPSIAITEYVFTNYRRFQTTITIQPGPGIPDPNAPPPPNPPK